jgi:FkbM family methyltransferase
MLTKLTLAVRERYHPLFHLRKMAPFRWAIGKLHFPIAIRIDGISHPVCVDFARNLSWVLSNGQVPESRERANFQRLTESTGCKSMYDVGANVGLYAFTFTSSSAARRVLMFEPDNLNARLLQATLTRFQLRNCELVEAAVCDRDGVLTFHSDSVSGATGSINEGSSFLHRHHQGETVAVTVRSVSLDKVSTSAASDPDVIKIDCEGAELSIFHGAEELLSRSHPMLFFECSENKAEIGAFLSGKGYRLFDPTTLEKVEFPHFNCLALHTERHDAVIRSIQ